MKSEDDKCEVQQWQPDGLTVHKAPGTRSGDLVSDNRPILARQGIP